MKYPIQVKWLYAPKEDQDGQRILVDRLWPRGRDRDELAVDDWQHDPAPSSALRRRASTESLNEKSFARLYRDELALHPERLNSLRAQAQRGPITLLTAEREPEKSPAWVLKTLLEQQPLSD